MCVSIGKEITKALNDTLITSEPLDRSQIGPGSIDFTTGNEFMRLHPQPVKCQPLVEYIPLPKFKESKEKAYEKRKVRHSHDA
jgi:hypothetical protein